MNGRNITLDEYLEGKAEYDGMTSKEQQQLVKDRDTFNVYRGDSESDDESDGSEGQSDSQEETKEEHSASDSGSSEPDEAQSSSSATPIPI